jgi:hypothetical protein
LALWIQQVQLVQVDRQVPEHLHSLVDQGDLSTSMQCLYKARIRELFSFDQGKRILITIYCSLNKRI